MRRKSNSLKLTPHAWGLLSVSAEGAEGQSSGLWRREPWKADWHGLPLKSKSGSLKKRRVDDEVRALANRVGGKQRIFFFGVFLLFPLFPDLSHHRTCRSAYGGSSLSVHLNIVVHQAGVASKAEFIVPCGVVHYSFRIGPVSFAAVPVNSRPVRLYAALD